MTAWAMGFGGVILLAMALSLRGPVGHGSTPAGSALRAGRVSDVSAPGLGSFPVIAASLLKSHGHWMLWCALVYLPLAARARSRNRPVRETRRQRLAAECIGIGWYAACGYLGLIAVHGMPGASVPWRCAVPAVAAGLSLFPFLYPIPRLYGLAVVLLPAACGASAWGAFVLRALGLSAGGAP